jgi:hypothetical protein
MATGVGTTQFGLMDVFANILPGVVVVTFVAASLHPLGTFAGTPFGVVEVTVLVVYSMVVGLVLQSVAITEEEVIDAVVRRVRPARDSAVADALSRRRFDDELRALGDSPRTGLDREFWAQCVDRFSLDEGFGRGERDFRQLRWALLAYLEQTSFSQAGRTRALYQLSRGLWSGSSLLVLYCLVLLKLPRYAPVEVDRAVLFAGVVSFSVLFVVLFGYKRLFHRLWFEFTVVEFYLDRTRNR